MKKISLFLVLIMILSLTSCNGYWCYFYERGIDSNPVIYYNDKTDEAFVAEYILDGNLENLEINIPEEYNDCIVNRLGGYYGTGVPTAFLIVLDGYVSTCKPDSLEDVIELKIVINLTKNIIEIDECALDYYITNEEKTYKLSYCFNCPSDNKVFYTKDGQLYYKSDDSLVSGLYNYIPTQEEIESGNWEYYS